MIQLVLFAFTGFAIFLSSTHRHVGGYFFPIIDNVTLILGDFTHIIDMRLVATRFVIDTEEPLGTIVCTQVLPSETFERMW